MNLRSKFRRKL